MSNKSTFDCVLGLGVDDSAPVIPFNSLDQVQPPLLTAWLLACLSRIKTLRFASQQTLNGKILRKLSLDETSVHERLGMCLHQCCINITSHMRASRVLQRRTYTNGLCSMHLAA